MTKTYKKNIEIFSNFRTSSFNQLIDYQLDYKN